MADLSVRELPLFPLPDIVLFPSDVLPLHIFESRYRMMLQSVLETDRRFGVVRWDPHTQSMASIGCCAEVIQHQTGEDGRSNIVTLGQQRFRVLNVTRETPFRTAMVSWIEDDPEDNIDELHTLTESVTTALRDVVELTGKLTDSPTALPKTFLIYPGIVVLDRRTSRWPRGRSTTGTAGTHLHPHQARTGVRNAR